MRFLWWHRIGQQQLTIVNEIQLYYLQYRTTYLRCSSGLLCSIQSMQLPVAVRTLPLRLSSAVVLYLKVTHNFCSKEKGSKAAPSTFLCTINSKFEREDGGCMFPQLRDTVLWHWYKKREDTEQEEEEVTRNHKWEKWFIRQVQPFPCKRRILISSNKRASSFRSWWGFVLLEQAACGLL